MTPRPFAPIFFLIGPTASGKTDVVRELGARLPLDVISSDSMQAYRFMPILSQVPPAALRKKVPHHLVEFLSPSSEYNAGLFAEKARQVIAKACRSGRAPLVSGGTGLYVTSLVDGLFPGPGKNAAYRRRLEREAAKSGPAALHERLESLDPDAAAKIHPNDLRRIVRALEVIHEADEKFSDMKARRKGIWNPATCRLYGLAPEREALYRRIDARVDRMFDDGLVDEVKRLMRRKLSQTAGMCLGLREVTAYLKGEVPLEKAREFLKRNTRRFAKRQIAWFKRDKRVRWFHFSEDPVKEGIHEKIAEDMEAFVGEFAGLRVSGIKTFSSTRQPDNPPTR